MKMKWIWSTIPDPLFFFTSRVSLHDYNSTIPFHKMSKETFFFDIPIFYFGRIITIMRIFQAWNWTWWGENCLSPLWRRFALPRTFECWYCPLCIWKGGKWGKRNEYDRHSKRERERDINTMQFLDNATQSLQDMRCEPSASTMR